MIFVAYLIACRLTFFMSALVTRSNVGMLESLSRIYCLAYCSLI